MTQTSDLRVTSHVGRDLLAQAASFKNEAAVVWEYVVNSLQYVDAGAGPRIQVRVDTRRGQIVISDNGRGMSRPGLDHFFQMHAENLERLAGRPGRGKFGTGKSAAFGIAGTLKVDTRRDGLRNVALLTRAMIEDSSGEYVPVDWQVRDEKTDDANGTVVTIAEVFLPRLRTAPIIEYIERHLQAFRAVGAEVAVNTHVCTAREPEVESQQTFQPTTKQTEVLGDVELVVRVARAPLPEVEQGIAVTSGVGNLVAVERGGIESKEFGSYLFGEVDVPALEESDSPIAPYDSSRSLELNPQHPVVARLVGFIGSKLEQVRKELVARAKDARRSEERRRLAVEADRIAEILNDDFRKVRRRLQEIRSAAAASGNATAAFGSSGDAGAEESLWVEGTQEPGVVEKTTGSGTSDGGAGRPDPEVVRRGERSDDGKHAVDPAGGAGRKAKPKGGFRVEYRELGKEEERSKYDSSSLTILINLDHPVVIAALGDGNTEDSGFRRLSYEIAFSEYAMGLGYETFKSDPNIPADDMLYEVRSSLHRVASAATALYR